MRDLLHAPADEVAAERARVEHEGWGAALLALEGPDGLWDGGACFPADYRGGEAGPAVDGDDAHAPDAAAPRARPRLLVREAGHRARRAERTVGARPAALLRRRGRAVHQRPDDRDRRVLRRADRRARRAAARRAARGRRLELRGRERLGPLVLRHDSRRARRTARSRAGERPVRRGGRGAAERRGVPARAEPVPAQEHRRGGRPRVPRPRVPVLLALRRAARARPLPPGRRLPDPRMAPAVEVVRSKRQADGRWLLDRIHPGRVDLELDGPVGTPSRLDHPAGAAGPVVVGRRGGDT